jgi:signal transduction histidine kinase
MRRYSERLPTMRSRWIACLLADRYFEDSSVKVWIQRKLGLSIGGLLGARKSLTAIQLFSQYDQCLLHRRHLSERLPVPDTRDELQRLSEIGRFTADASHELRNLWSFVRTLAEVSLRSSQADPASLKAFEEIVEESGKAKRLLEDMLRLARADAGKCAVGL